MIYVAWFVYFGPHRVQVAVAPEFATSIMDQAVIAAFGWVLDAYKGLARGSMGCADVAIERVGASGVPKPILFRALPCCGSESPGAACCHCG